MLEKPIYTIFTRQILNTNPMLSLRSEDINASKKVKFPGLDLNYKLTWTNHVIKIVVKKQQKNQHAKTSKIKKHKT